MLSWKYAFKDFSTTNQIDFEKNGAFDATLTRHCIR